MKTTQLSWADQQSFAGNQLIFFYGISKSFPVEHAGSTEFLQHFCCTIISNGSKESKTRVTFMAIEEKTAGNLVMPVTATILPQELFIKQYETIIETHGDPRPYFRNTYVACRHIGPPGFFWRTDIKGKTKEIKSAPLCPMLRTEGGNIRDQGILATLTAQTLSSGILQIGSCAELVRILAQLSMK